MRTRLIDCPDCGKSLSPAAFACTQCGKPMRPPPRNEGPFLRSLNALTLGALLLIGVPLAFGIVVSLLQAAWVLVQGVLSPLK